MSGFISRWARRKAAIREAEAQSTEPPIDLATLPPIDTLDAASDFAAFLKRGVPTPLQTQALRVAWESDAAIAGFRGMAEYDWDFNAEGYGRLAATDDVAALLRRIVASDPPAEAPTEFVASADAPVAVVEAPPPPAPVAIAEAAHVEAAPQPEETQAPSLRRHGGALPS